MKRNLTFLFILFVSTIIYSQNNPTSKLLVIYSQEQIEYLEDTNPQLLNYYMNFAEKGMKVETIVDDKYLTEIPQLSVITLHKMKSDASELIEEISVQEFLNDYNSSEFNPLKYNLYPKQKRAYYYLAGTDKILIIESASKLID